MEDIDNVIICGDFNARVGHLDDCNEALDDTIPKRQNIDDTVNSHGHTFTEFLKDAKMCMLNGRISPLNDNFTSISVKGKSVVDYMCVQHEDVRFCKNFCVTTCSSLMHTHGLQPLLSDECKAPDHSILTLTLSLPNHEYANNNVNKDSDLQCNDEKNHKVYKVKNIPENVLTSESSRLQLLHMIEELEQTRIEQNELDAVYIKFTSLLCEEMDRKLPHFIPGKSKKYFRVNKPYWNQELQKCWDTMREKETVYIKYRGPNRLKKTLRNDFKTAMQSFDKKLRYYKKQYRYNSMNEIESCKTENPKQFWEYIKKLGPKKKRNIPLKVYGEDGCLTSCKQTVLNKWKNDFESLFKSNDLQTYDATFYKNAIDSKRILETDFTQEFHESHLNKVIDQEEVQKI